MSGIFRKAVLSDLETVMPFYEAAVAYFAAAGINQWQNGYPNKGVIEADILAGRTMVWEEAGCILGALAYCPGIEPTYNEIFEGAWRMDGVYTAIHRVAVSPSAKGRGIAGKMFVSAAKIAKESGSVCLRCDTHRQNLSMQRALEKGGFTRCGIIYLENGDERLAFDCLL